MEIMTSSPSGCDHEVLQDAHVTIEIDEGDTLTIIHDGEKKFVFVGEDGQLKEYVSP